MRNYHVRNEGAGASDAQAYLEDAHFKCEECVVGLQGLSREANCGKKSGDIAKNHCHANPGRPANQYDVRPRGLCEPETDIMRQQTLTLFDLDLPTGRRDVGGGLRHPGLHPIRV